MDDEHRRGGRAPSPAFLDRDLDALRTPPDPRGPVRKFGARVDRSSSNYNNGNSRGNGMSGDMTPSFSRVAGNVTRTRGRYHSNGDDVGDFNFSDAAEQQRQQQQQQQRHNDSNHTNSRNNNPWGKYAAPPTRPRPSGKPITPGASLDTLRGDAHLTQGFFPPSTQSSFMANLVTTSNKGKSKAKAIANANATAAAKASPKRLRPTSSALEHSSAPTPAAAFSKPLAPTLGWQERFSTHRIQITPAKRSLQEPTRSSSRIGAARGSLASAAAATRYQTTAPPRNRDVMLQNTTTQRLLTDAALPTRRRAPVDSIGRTMTTRRSVKKQIDGTADQPIDLDSDSDDGKNDDAATSMRPSKRRLAQSTTLPTKSRRAIKRPKLPRLQPAHWKTVDVDAIARAPIAEVQGAVVWLGRLRCIADVFVRPDSVWLCRIRTLSKWNRMEHLELRFADCTNVSLYRVDDNVAPIVDDADLTPMDERVLAKQSFVALRAACTCDVDRDALQAFYDPIGDDPAKQFVVIESPDYDTRGSWFSALETFVTEHHPALLTIVVDAASGKQLLQALVAEPFDDNEGDGSDDGRTADATNSNDVDVNSDDSECFDVQLTYPLPPCASDIVTITRGDIARLRPSQYLNDNIIDYYFKRIMLENYANDAFIQRNVLFLSSHFYSRLRAGTGSITQRYRNGYENVATWVARTDFFKRHMVFIPINNDMHWSLAVIVNPRSAAVESPSEDQPPSCIAVFDPLGNYHNKKVIRRHIKSFLQFEWERTVQAATATAATIATSVTNDLFRNPDATAATASEPAPSTPPPPASSTNNSHKRRKRPLPPRSPLTPTTYNVERVADVEVDAPRQQNSFDCGVYVLKMADTMLENYRIMNQVGSNTGPIPKDEIDDKFVTLLPPRCISPDDITELRVTIQQAINDDTGRYHDALAAVRRDEKNKKSVEAAADVETDGREESDDDTVANQNDDDDKENDGDVHRVDEQRSLSADSDAALEDAVATTTESTEQVEDDSDNETELTEEIPSPSDNDTEQTEALPTVHIVVDVDDAELTDELPSQDDEYEEEIASEPMIVDG